MAWQERCSSEFSSCRAARSEAGKPSYLGLHPAFQELLGTKRAAYYLYTGAEIDARSALELGLVNEVLPADRLSARAWQLAETIAARVIGRTGVPRRQTRKSGVSGIDIRQRIG